LPPLRPPPGKSRGFFFPHGKIFVFPHTAGVVSFFVNAEERNFLLPSSRSPPLKLNIPPPLHLGFSFRAAACFSGDARRRVPPICASGELAFPPPFPFPAPESLSLRPICLLPFLRQDKKRKLLNALIQEPASPTSLSG